MAKQEPQYDFSPKGSSSDKKPSQGDRHGSKLPLVIGLLVLAALIIGAAVFFLLPKEKQVTVNQGEGSGSFKKGTLVAIKANDPEEKKVFDAWKVLSGNITLSDEKAAATSFVMGDEDVILEAVYTDKAYQVTVKNGEGSGNYTPGETVVIKADEPDDEHVFAAWETDDPEVVLSEENAETASFSMPDADVSIEAVYEEKPYPVTVLNGEGSGDYKPGEIVTVKAAEPEKEKVFLHWKVQEGMAVLADENAQTTSFSMTKGKLILEACYADKTYPLTVEGGSGSGDYKTGDSVTLTADPAPQEERFRSWEVREGSAVLADPAQATTTLTMPSEAVKVSVVYEPMTYPTVVENGSGSGEYERGAEVTIQADSAGSEQVFSHWQVLQGDISLADEQAGKTSFSMPSEAVQLRAVYADKTYSLTVNNGEGSGDYTADSVVKITADQPQSGFRFVKWTSNSPEVVFADQAAPRTTIKMPHRVAAVEAVYEQIPYNVRVTNGVLGNRQTTADYVPGKEVTITADDRSDEVLVFTRWNVTNGSVSLADETAAQTAFIMPSSDVEITAEYESAIKSYRLTAEGAEIVSPKVDEDGLVPEGTEVQVKASDAQEDEVFFCWDEGEFYKTGTGINGKQEMEISFTMPSMDYTIQAVYLNSKERYIRGMSQFTQDLLGQDGKYQGYTLK